MSRAGGSSKQKLNFSKICLSEEKLWLTICWAATKPTVTNIKRKLGHAKGGGGGSGLESSGAGCEFKWQTLEEGWTTGTNIAGGGGLFGNCNS